MPVGIEYEIDRAGRFGQRLEDLVYNAAKAGKVVSEDEVKKIRNDRFKVNYDKDGARIDKVLGSGSLFEGFLKGSRDMLHRPHALRHRAAAEPLGRGRAGLRVLRRSDPSSADDLLRLGFHDDDPRHKAL
jgi:hypothetical protein